MKNTDTNSNPLLCDIESGICEIPAAPDAQPADKPQPAEKALKIIYFTDPICSTCWGIEPQLRKLKLAYANDISIEYHMGGLLPDWSYNSGGISKPADVAHHWDEVSAHYQMPIDGDVWLEDPLPSSYPPSIAFKAAQLQHKDKAIAFLRILRERVFLRKQNITRQSVIEQAAADAGLNTQLLLQHINGEAKPLFEQDLDLARSKGVRGFPTIFITNGTQTELVYGYKPYNIYVDAIEKLQPGIAAVDYDKNHQSLFGKYPTLTTREFAELSDISFNEAEAILKDLALGNVITEYATKNGSLWISHSA